MNLSTKIDTIEKKVRTLGQRFDQLKNEYKLLQTAHTKLKEEQDLLKAENAELKKENELQKLKLKEIKEINIKLEQSQQTIDEKGKLGKDESRKLRQQLDQYIKEIDECIEWLQHN